MIGFNTIRAGLWSVFYSLFAIGKVPPIVIIIMAWWYNRKKKQLAKAEDEVNG